MQKNTKRITHFLITLVIVAVGVVVFLVLTAQKPQLQKTKPPVRRPTVRALRVATDTRQVVIRGEGIVHPLREIQLVPQVGGKLIYVSPALVDGGEFKTGDVLLRIDPMDYQLAVTLGQARIKDSESKLKVLEEEAAVAEEEWQLLYSDKSEYAGSKPSALVLKEPQLAAAWAKLAADRADLQKVRLALARTQIKAPFNGRVSAETVDAGQYVSIGQKLATLFSTKAAEIVVPLEDENLFWFHVPGFTPGSGPGAPVVVKARVAGRELIWNGVVVRAEGKLDEHTRMVNVVVRVEKPYARKPPLVSGLFVTVEIQGRSLAAAVSIPRTALQDDNIVWVVAADGQLSFRKVDVAWRSRDSIILNSGLLDGELVVISPLKIVTDGMKVRVNANEDNQS
jgi:RND family efflux transporter MFP subunit